MEKFIEFTGIVAPLERSNVDTDQIIPAVYLKRVTKSGFDDALFASWRQDPDFILNNPAFSAAKILVTGSDFGTGSSREHAVWALRDYGFRAVFSSRFADIFRGNAGKQGLLAGLISEEDTQKIWQITAENPGIEAKVDLVNRVLTIADLEVKFEIDDYTRWRLLEGLDDIGLTLMDESLITDFESRRENWRPKTLPVK